MDFIYDYEDDPVSSQGNNTDASINLLPIPAAPLNLSNLNVYREDLSQRFSNLNILKNLQAKQAAIQQQQQQQDQQQQQQQQQDQRAANELVANNDELIDDMIDEEQSASAQKYAQLSLELIKDESKNLKVNHYINPNIEDTTMSKSVQAAAAAAAAAAASTSTTTASQDGDITKSATVLATRLARILNTSNFDSGIGEALVLLQARIDDQQRKRKDHGIEEDPILSIDYDTLTDTGLIGSVSRRKLRNEIENDLLRQQYQTLKNFQPIVKKLNSVKENLTNLNTLNDDLLSNLSKISHKSKNFTESVTTTKKEKALISLKKQLLQNFQKNYTLTRYEEFYLINEDINEDYLKILQKAEDIYKNCSILLILDNPKVGSSIMAQMQDLIQLATKRILNFIKKQFQSFLLMGNNNDLDSEAKHMVFKRCLVYMITTKPDHLNEIMDDLIFSRSKILVDEFLAEVNGYSDALQNQDMNGNHTSKSSSKSSKKKKNKDDSRPLMLNIYDSKRFLSDILAYLHDVIVSERELFNNLFDIDDDVISSYDRDDDELKDGNVKAIAKLVDNIINKNLDVLSKPLKSKIEQIIRSESKLVILQNILQLFELYKLIYTKALKSEDNSILEIISSLQQITAERVMSVTKQKLHNIRYKNKNDQEDDHIEEIDDDLNIPEWLFEFYGTVSPLFDNLDSDEKSIMQVFAKDENAFKTMVYDDVLSILDIEIKQNHLKGTPKLVFLLNCYDYISSKLITVKSFANKWQDLNEKMNSLKNQLILSQFQLLLKETGLQDIYNLINMIFALDNDYFDVSIYEPITENKMFNFKFFKEVNFKLLEVIPLALIDYQLTDLTKILSPSLSNDISIDSSVEFINFYHKLWLITKAYLKVDNVNDVDPNNFNGHPVFKWSDIELSTLLGCEEFYRKQREDYEENSDDDDNDSN